MIKKQVRTYLSLFLSFCMLLSFVGIFSATAQTPVVHADGEGYVWVVRSYTLKEGEFDAASSRLSFLFDWQGFTPAPANIVYDSMALLCDGVPVESIAMGQSFAKGSATSNFAAHGSYEIPKGNHVITVKLRVKATDADAAYLERNIAPFFFYGEGLVDGKAYWMIDGLTNNITLSEMQTGTPGYNDPTDNKSYVRVDRTWHVQASRYTAEKGMLNFNCTLQFGSTVCPADVHLKALEIVCDGELLQVVDLSMFSYQKGQTLAQAFVEVNPWNTVEIPRGDHDFRFTFVLSVENASDEWLGEINGLPIMVWSPAISNGGGYWVTDHESNYISVKEMISGSETTVPYMENGASVRLAQDTGLRFETVINKTFYEEQVALYGRDQVKLGTMIAPAVYVKQAGSFTVEALEALQKNSVTYLDIPANAFYREEGNTYTVAGSILNIKDTHYTLDFAAIGYMEVNGVRTYASHYVVRNIEEVASLALADVKPEQTAGYNYAIEGRGGVFSPYTANEQVLLAGFCKSSVGIPIILSAGASEYRFASGCSSVSVDLSTGLVKKLSTAQGELSCNGVLVDVGANGAYAAGSLSFQSYDDKASQWLPGIQPQAASSLQNANIALFWKSGSLYIRRTEGEVTTLYRYTLTDDMIAVDTVLSSATGAPVLVNGVAFSVLGMDLPQGVTYEYPGNMPYGSFDLQACDTQVANETMFMNSVTHFTGGGKHWNIYFNDVLEKWSTGVWRSADGKANLCNLAAVECMIEGANSCSVGSLYFRFPDCDPYKDVQAWYQDLGYAVNAQTPETGPIYCGHPAGTSDSNYVLGENLFAYANRLQELKDIGFETIWTMPLTVHKGYTDFYSPTDLSKLDDRYGGKDQAKYFIAKAHALGMKVIFDFVPHGLSEESTPESQKGWVSQGRDGQLFYEWDCFAFDYSNQSYQSYVQSIMKDYALNLGVDGVRFDSAQGSRNNWNRTDGLRPSASSLNGGVSMTQAVKNGFAEGGKDAIILPEMFSPIPNFTGETNLYYNNALYRVLMDLNANYQQDRTVYTQKLMQFLSIQNQTKVPGQVMANWLQNHDTVLWSGDAMRAEELYGSEWVRNMFRMISWIDGVPVIYMGDENAAEYGVGNSNLSQFFTDTFALRREYLPTDAATEYLFSDQPVFAFYRGSADASDRCLILLNFSESAQSFALPQGGQVLFAENAACEGSTAQLQGYGCLVLQISGGAA